ncbi:hypothetical protein ACOMHN_044094 [Nucella lapillus]
MITDRGTREHSSAEAWPGPADPTEEAAGNKSDVHTRKGHMLGHHDLRCPLCPGSPAVFRLVTACPSLALPIVMLTCWPDVI